ncbi:ATP-binding protein [Streptomyces chrestomyceticus]|uniref:ATP-binding protein n=1 Tax=Streptomyces chrestomyceticus TaxID=68185 RepID=UPI0036B1BDB5
MSLTITELMQDGSLGGLLRHCAVPLKELAAPQKAARAALLDILGAHGRPDWLDTAVLIASELVANAIQHTAGPLSITIEVYEKGLAMGVVDRGADITAVPARLANSCTDGTEVAASGRGLFIIDCLASDWSVAPVEDGKIIKAVLDIPAGPVA